VTVFPTGKEKTRGRPPAASVAPLPNDHRHRRTEQVCSPKDRNAVNPSRCVM